MRTSEPIQTEGVILLSKRNSVGGNAGMRLFTATAAPHPRNFSHTSAPAWVQRGGIRF
ncbi:MAG: hypothetical protein [Microvirus sp.]|nr:MAG: hypothetical protein [Microvirus sp.]